MIMTKKDRKVTFRVSTGFVGAEIAETFKLSYLGIIEENYKTEKELLDEVESSYKDWLWDNITATWDFEE